MSQHFELMCMFRMTAIRNGYILVLLDFFFQFHYSSQMENYQWAANWTCITKLCSRMFIETRFDRISIRTEDSIQYATDKFKCVTFSSFSGDSQWFRSNWNFEFNARNKCIATKQISINASNTRNESSLLIGNELKCIGKIRCTYWPQVFNLLPI